MNSMMMSEFKEYSDLYGPVVVELGCYKFGTLKALIDYAESEKKPIRYFGCDIDKVGEAPFSDYVNWTIAGETTSVKFLQQISSQIVGRNPLIYLDAHYSGDDRLWQKSNECPIFAELAIIAGMRTSALLVVDDVRVFAAQEAGLTIQRYNLNPEQWPTYTELLDYIVRLFRVESLTYNNDRLFVSISGAR